jgi:hypothetical protein
MAGYRKVKHVYDDNWEDRNQFKTLIPVEWDDDEDWILNEKDADQDEIEMKEEDEISAC